MEIQCFGQTCARQTDGHCDSLSSWRSQKCVFYLRDICNLIQALCSPKWHYMVFIWHKNIQSLHTKVSVDLIWFKKNTIYATQCQVITCTKMFDRILIVFDQKTYNFAIKCSSIAPIKRSLFNFLSLNYVECVFYAIQFLVKQ